MMINPATLKQNFDAFQLKKNAKHGCETFHRKPILLKFVNLSTIFCRIFQKNLKLNQYVKMIPKSKHHKENFKIYLDPTNKNETEVINLNQWRNTEAVSDWSKSISNKNLFSIFDT